MSGGKTFKDTFIVPTSGTFYTKSYSNWVSPISALHLYSADAAVVTDCQYQTSNWKDERDLSGSGGNQYWYTEPSASVGPLVAERFTGSVGTSVVSHLGNNGSKYWRLKITCDAGGVFIMNFHGKD